MALTGDVKRSQTLSTEDCCFLCFQPLDLTVYSATVPVDGKEQLVVFCGKACKMVHLTALGRVEEPDIVY
jgi:hypothetical protein